MGAYNFITSGRGKSAADAFHGAVSAAAYEYGHGGYTGTIAEKREFIEIPLPEGRDASSYAQELIDEYDERISDKWGPAGCIDAGNGKFIFFGWASS